MSAIVAAVSTAVRLYLIWNYQLPELDTENMRAGLALASRGTLADPFIMPTGATAHVAPLYPALIAAGVGLSGDPETGLQLARSLVAICFGCFLTFLPTLARWCGFPERVGLLAALVFAFPTPPIFLWIELSGQHETVLTTMLFAVAAAATLGAICAGRLTKPRAALLGLAWALGAHSSPVIAPPLLALLATSWLFLPLDRRRLTTSAITLLVVFTAAVTPWTIRNARVIGGLSFIRDNFGLELAVSNSNDSSPDMRENMGSTMTRHPFFDRDEALKMQVAGERRYYERRGAEAKEWIRTHPQRFIWLTLHRVRLFFLPRLGLEHHPLFYGTILALAPVGLVLSWRRRVVEQLALVAMLFAFAAPHFLVQSTPRYSYPVLWILVLFASSAGLESWGLVMRRLRERDVERARA